MPGTTYGLSFAEMNTAIETAGSLAQRFTSTLEDMNNELKAKLATWTGDAQAEYQMAYTTCRLAALQMPATLTQAQAALSQITDGYGTAERTVAGTFS